MKPFLLGLIAFSARPADATEDLEAITAEALFRDGKAFLERHDYARACPLLSASVTLDPATGALLALAICHEGEGKLASAAGEYERVAARAAAEHRPDRVQVARARSASIAPRISTLTIVPPVDAARLEGLSVRRNGATLEASSLGVPIPSDGGDYSIEVSAANRIPWRTTVSLKASSDAQTLAVPTLAEASAAKTDDSAPARTEFTAVPRAVPASLASTRGTSGSPGLVLPAEPTKELATRPGPSALRIAGLALMGGGLAALAAGTVYGLRAMSKNQDSRNGCDGNSCDPDGRRDRLAALSAGDKATFAFVAGGIAAAAGVTLFVIGKRAPTAAMAAKPESLSAGVAIGPGGADLLVRLTLDP